MPMTGAERDLVLAQIAQLLEVDVHDELMTFYAMAVALSEKHPEQVNNEIRNAVTHICRALKADSYDEAIAQIKQARVSHIERAKRDSLKLSLAEVCDNLRFALEHLKISVGVVAPELLVRRRDLLARREEILREEINGSDTCVDDILELFNEAKSFQDDVVSAYNAPARRGSLWRLRLIVGWRWFSNAVTAVVLGLIVFTIAAMWAPDTITFGHSLRQLFGFEARTKDDSAKLPPAANNPSTGEKPGAPKQPAQP